MKKLLILGAKGTLGQALIEQFQNSYEVISWDREDIDVSQYAETREKITSLPPDFIIKAYGIYHGTNNGGSTWYEWAKKVFELRNITIDLAPVSHTQFPRPARAPKYSVLENTKMPKQRSWEDALQEYLMS